jgi:hypothetical protein
MQGDAADVVRGVEASVRLGDRGDAIAHGGKRLACRRVLHRALLQPRQGGDEVEAVGDVVVHLAQQHGALARELLRAVAGLAHRGLGGVMRAAQRLALDGAVDRRAQQQQEVTAGFLDDVVRCPGAMRRRRCGPRRSQ